MVDEQRDNVMSCSLAVLAQRITGIGTRTRARWRCGGARSTASKQTVHNEHVINYEVYHRQHPHNKRTYVIYVFLMNQPPKTTFKTVTGYAVYVTHTARRSTFNLITSRLLGRRWMDGMAGAITCAH